MESSKMRTHAIVREFKGAEKQQSSGIGRQT